MNYRRAGKEAHQRSGDNTQHSHTHRAGKIPALTSQTEKAKDSQSTEQRPRKGIPLSSGNTSSGVNMRSWSYLRNLKTKTQKDQTVKKYLTIFQKSSRIFLEIQNYPTSKCKIYSFDIQPKITECAQNQKTMNHREGKKNQLMRTSL